MRYLMVIALLALTVVSFASTEAESTAKVKLLIEKYVALDLLDDIKLTVKQDPPAGTNPADDPYCAQNIDGLIGTDDADYTLWKNCDVMLSVSATKLFPLVNGVRVETDPAIGANTPHSLPLVKCTLNGEDFTEAVPQLWEYCRENGGEHGTFGAWWLRNGLCDHAGFYEGDVTLFAISEGQIEWPTVWPPLITTP